MNIYRCSEKCRKLLLREKLPIYFFLCEKTGILYYEEKYQKKLLFAKRGTGVARLLLSFYEKK